MPAPFEIFLAAPPGLEPLLCAEAAAAGFAGPSALPGGVTVLGGWPEVWRANLELRGAGRVLARIGAFRAMHLAQLDKRARKLAWGDVLRADVPLRLDVTTRKSRIYHAGAARSRIAAAIRETLGAPVPDDPPEDAVTLKVRIDDDLCTLSVDTSGAPLHRRGAKQAVNAAPMRETLAALFLRAAGYGGTEPVLDPMCGSGTFVIEAAEIAAGLKPGRSRRFAFELLANHDAAAWDRERAATAAATPAFRFHGSDRDAGAIAGARANAKRAGVDTFTAFETRAVSDITPPDGPPGLIVCNPPYGTRIGDKKPLFALYGAFGKTVMARFHGWRVAIITTDESLARATGLRLRPHGKPVSHGGLSVRLFTAPPLG